MPLTARRPTQQLVDLVGTLGVAPVLLGSAQLIEGLIADVEKAALLEIRRDDAPAAPKIAIKAVSEHVLKGADGIGLLGELGLGLLGEIYNGQTERVENTLGEDIVKEAGGSGLFGGGIESPAQQTDFDEVVEVAGL